MLGKIYKYTPYRKAFFENFLIRGSQKYALNDPFELRPSSSHIRSKSKKEIFDKLSKASYFDYSIVSLTETNNNLLMWSHYADQHKGIVIEFDYNYQIFDSYKSFPVFDFDNEEDAYIKNSIETERVNKIDAGKIQKVYYNNMRPNIKKFDSILEHFLIKSDEWIYEKEHRVILPLVTADYIIINKKHLPDVELSISSSGIEEIIDIGDNMAMVNIKDCMYKDAQDILYHCSSPFLTEEENIQKYIDATYSQYLRDLSEDPTTIFLYKVPPKSIKSVYMGCRMEDRHKKELRSLLRNNSQLKHVKLYETRTSQDRFELEFKKS